PDREGDTACIACHAETAPHAHHAAGSPGASCLACHMPRTSYALLGAIRSHTIDSPSARSTAHTGEPNACNLCHADRSLAWTANKLTEWYGAAPVALSEDAASVPYGELAALRGDAATRVLMADALGEGDATAAGGRVYREAPLAELLVDPY